jgi:crossover junction endodeoxyribonuclease RuvC
MGVVFMGVDLSLTSTGLSVNGETSAFKSKNKGAARLYEISNHVLTDLSVKGANCVIIESYSYASRNSQAHSIGELGGCVRMTLWQHGIPFIEVPPTSRAKFATGKGNAGKTEVISAVSSKTGKLFSGSSADDECDAWVLEQMGLAKINNSDYSWTKEQLSALDKIDWSPLDTLVIGEK